MTHVGGPFVLGRDRPGDGAPVGGVGTVSRVLTSRRTPRLRRRLGPVAGVLVAAAALAACAEDAPQDTWDPAGPNAQKIHDLQWPVFAIAGLVMVLVFAAIVYAVVRFRDRGQPIPEQTHGKPALEIGLTILPALILIGVAVPTVGTLMALSRTSDTECVVNVTGQQWWWEVDYPSQDGCGGIATSIVTSGQMVIPTGTKVLVRGTSRDVIHSWWIPRLNGKRDMVPGRVHSVRLEADEPGIYAGQCTEFCGLSHANMRMEVVALDPADFETWKANQLGEYTAPEDETLAALGEELFLAQCASCHQVNGLLDGEGVPVIAAPETRVYSGAAPNLSYFMTRNTFAGASWDLLTDECRDRVWNAAPEEFGARYLEGVTAECLNQVDLREWLRNAPEKKPMFADPEELAATDGLYRGMPNLALSEQQIDQLVAYLLERS
ncbi:MAG: cytochrome c oxidase subunit II [Acidimicrobiia bacterium]|nr:cytochrome c oxidase subunit II [Acidimicrobiia bacterium]